MRRWVVRVVTNPKLEADRDLTSGRFLGLLAEAGVLQIHRLDPDRGSCFDVPPPVGTEDSILWATRTSSAMQAAGINAVPAPEWPK